MLSIRYTRPAGVLISGLFLSLLISFSKPILAEHPSPFLTKNQSPFTLIHGIPLASSAQLLKLGQSRLITSLNVMNTLNADIEGNERFLIDLETWNLNLIHDYAFKQDWMFRAQLPLIAHSGGTLDSPIDEYHQLLGLPENLRPDFPKDQIDIFYSDGNERLISIDDDQQSVGDISLQLAYQANQDSNSSSSYWLSLKLPTGDEDKLTGSGSFDIAGWVATDYRLSGTRWLYGQAGLIFMDESEVLTDRHNDWAGFASAGIKFEPWNQLHLKAQFDMHTAVYDSELKFLGDIIQLTFGGSYIFNSTHSVDFAVAEDIDSDSSPDVNFNINWWLHY